MAFVMIGSFQLEGLKTDYEQQVATLKEELDKERQQPSTTMPAAKVDRDDQLADIKRRNEEAIDQLRANLEPSELDVFDRLREQMTNAHEEETQYMKNDYAEELKSQLDVLQSTMQTSHSNQLELLKTELEMEKAQHHEDIQRLREKLDSVRKQRDVPPLGGHDSSHLLEALKGQLGLEHQEMLEMTSRRFEEKYVEHIEELKKENLAKQTSGESEENWKQDQAARLSQADALRQDMIDLRSRLQAEYECLLELQRGYKKERTLVAEEVEKLTERNRTLMEKYERELQELRQQLEAKEKSAGDSEMEELFETLRNKLSESHQRQLRDLGQQFDQKYQRHLEAVRREMAAKKDGEHHQNGDGGAGLSDIEALRNELYDTHSRLQGEYNILLDLKSEMLTGQSSAVTQTPVTNGSQDLIEKYEKEISELKNELEKAELSDRAKSRELQDLENEYKRKIIAMETNYEETIEHLRLQQMTPLSVHPPIPSLMVTPSSPEESSPEGSPHKVSEKYTQELEVKVRELEEQLENVRTFLEAEHQAQMDDLRIDYESRSELEIEKARLDMEDAQAKEIEEIEAKYEKMMEGFPAELEKVKTEMERAHAAEVEELEAKYQKEIENYQRKVVDHVEEQVSSEWVRVEAEMKEVIQEKEKEIEKLKAEIARSENEMKITLDSKDKEVETLKAELDAASAAKDKELDELRKEHKETVNELQKEHDRALDELEIKLRAKIAEEEDDELALEALQKEHEEELATLRQELTEEFGKKITELEQKLSARDEEEKADEDALEALRNEHEEELEELRQELLEMMEQRLSDKEYEVEATMAEKYEDDIADLQDTIRDKTAEIEKLIEDHTQKVEQMELAHQKELLSVQEQFAKDKEVLKSEFDDRFKSVLAVELAQVTAEHNAVLAKLGVEKEDMLKEKDGEIQRLEKLVEEMSQAGNDGDRSAELEEELVKKDEEIARLREGWESEANQKDLDSSIVAYENRLAEKEHELSEKDVHIRDLQKLNLELETLRSTFSTVQERSALDISSVSNVSGKVVSEQDVERLRAEYEERLNERDEMIRQLREDVEALEIREQSSETMEAPNGDSRESKPSIMDELVPELSGDGAVFGEIMPEHVISVQMDIEQLDSGGGQGHGHDLSEVQGHDSSGEGQTGLGFIEGDSIDFGQSTDIDSGLTGTASTFEVTGDFASSRERDSDSTQDITNLMLMHQSELESVRTQYEDRCSRLERDYRDQLEKLQRELDESHVEKLQQKVSKLQKQIEEKHQAEADDIQGIVENMELMEGGETKVGDEEMKDDEKASAGEVDFVASARVQELEDKIEKLKEELEETDAKLEWARAGEKASQNSIEELKEKVKEKKIEVERLRGVVSDLRNDLDDLQSSLQDKEEELDQLKAENDRADLMVEKLREEVQNYKNQMDRFSNLEERMDGVIEECKELREELRAKELEVESLVLEKEGMERELDGREELEVRLKELEGEVERLVLEKEALEKESDGREELEVRLKELEGEVEKLVLEKEELQKASASREELEAKLQEREAEIGRLVSEKEELEKVSAGREELEAKLQEREAEIERLVAEKEELEKGSSELEALEAKLKEKEAKLEESMNELDNYCKELDTLRKSHREEVEQYESNIRMLEQQYDVKMVEEDYNEKVRALERNYAERVDTIRKELRENYELETGKMTQKHRQEVQSLELTIKALQADLEQNQAIETSDLESMKEDLEKKYEEQLAAGIATRLEKEQTKFLEEHQQMVKKFAEDKEIEMNELKEKFDNEKAELEREHGKKLSQLKDEHAKEIEDIQVRLEQTSSADDPEIERLKQHHQREIENIKLKLQEESLAEQRKKLEEMTQEMEASRNEEVERMKERVIQDHHAELERFRVALDNKELDMQERIRELEQKHEDELQAAKEESKKRINEELSRLLDAHQQEIRAITLDNEREKSDLEEAHCQVIIDLRERLKHSHLQAVDEIEQHYKNEFDELEKHHTEEMEKMKQANDEDKERLRRQLDAQFQDTISTLQRDLEAQQLEMESQREESSKFHVNMAALRDYVEQCMGIEELITRKLVMILGSQARRSLNTSMNGKGPEESEGSQADDTLMDASMASVASDSENMSLSQHLCESLFITPGMEEEEKQMLTDSSSKLKLAVESLLDMVATTTEQLQESQKIQRQLLEDVNEKEHELRGIQEQLEAEKDQKNYLAEELHRTEGLLGSIKGENAELENGIQQLVNDRNVMDHDLETTRNRLQEFEESESDLKAKEDELERQRLAIEEKVSGEDKGLLFENQRLAAEKRDQQRQFEKDREEYSKRILELEMTVEELQLQNDRLGDDKSADTEDLRLQIETMEERLRSNKQFLEEQTAEREQEREENQREIEKLLGKLKEKSKDEKVESRLQRELDEVLDQLRDKTDQYSELLLKKEQLERDLLQMKQEKSVLDDTVCHLEAELCTKNNTEEELNRKIAAIEQELAKQHDIAEELVQSREQESMSKQDVESLISDLRAELDSKARGEQLALKQKMELEKELDKMRRVEEELATDRDAFQATVNEQLIQISNLKSALDQLRCNSESDSAKADMQRALDAEKEAVEMKDKELRDLVDQVEKFRSDLMEKDSHCMQLQLQFETGAKELEYLTRKHHEQLEEVKKRNKELENELKNVKDEVDNQGITPFAQVLLDSKNEEIDFLNDQVARLETQLGDNKAVEAQAERAERLAKELEEKAKNIESLETDLSDLKQTVEKLQEAQDLSRHLQADVEIKDEKIEELKREVEEKEQLRIQVQAELDHHRSEEISQLNILVTEKENSIEQLTTEIESLTAEVKNLTEFQQSFQDDYDTIHAMLEEKQAEVEVLSRELMETRPPIDGASVETQEKFEKEVATLKKELKEKQNVIDEKEEELYELKEQMDAQEEKVKLLTNQLEERVKVTSEWKQQVDLLIKEVKVKDTKISELNNSISSKEDEISKLSRDVSNKENEIVRLLQRTPEAGDTGHPDQALREFKKKVEDQRKTIQDLRDQLLDLKDTLRTKQQELDKVSSLGEEYKELLKEQESNHESEMDLLRREKDSKINSLEDQLADAKRDTGYRTSDSLSSVDEKVQELETKHKADLEKLEVKVKEEAEVKIQELKLQHSEEVAKLKEKHDLEVSNLTDQIRDEFDKKCANDINILRQQHEQELRVLRRNIDENGSLTDIAKQLNAELLQSERLDSSLLAQFDRKRQEGVGQENSSQVEGFSSADSSGLDQQNEDHNIPDRLQVLLSRLHNEGVQVLTLSELQFIQQHRSLSPVDKAVDVSSLQQAWENEKQSLMEAVQALKDLLARTQHTRTSDKKSPEQVSDWRADLVKAINYVFAKERESLLAELRTQVISHPEEEVSVYNSLERRIKEQESKHDSAMEQIFSADRQSLLAEIRDLRAHMNVMRIESREEKQRYADNISSNEELTSKKERQMKSQIDLLEYKLKQEKVLVEDLRSSLDTEKSRTIEISSQLGREKNRCTDLQSDIGNLQNKLTSTEEQLSREKARLNTLLSSLEDERTKSNHLREALEIEQKNCEQYRDEAQKARKKIDVAKEREQYLMEKWKQEIDSEKQQKMDALKALEQQRVVVSTLQRDMESERHLANKNEKEVNAKVNELKSALDIEKTKCNEINSALQRERTLRAELRESLDLERNNSLSKSQQLQSNLNDLQSRLDLEKSRYLDIASTLEREQKKVTTLNVALEGDRSQYLVDLEHARATCRQLKNNIDAIESQRQELARQLEFEKDRAHKLQVDCDRQRSELLRGQETEREVENQREAERFKERQQRKGLELELEKERQKSLEMDMLTTDLRQQCAELEYQLAENQREAIQVAQQHELEKMRRMQPSPDQDRAELEHALKMHEKELEIQHLKTKTADLESQLAEIEKQLFEVQSQQRTSPTDQEQIIKDQALRLHEKDSEVRLQRKKIVELEQSVSNVRQQMEGMSEELQEQRKQALSSTPMNLERDRDDLRQALKLQEKELEVESLTNRVASLEQQLSDAGRHMADLEQLREADRKQQHEKGIELKKVQHKLVNLEARLAREERPGDEHRKSEMLKEMLNKDDEIQKLKFKVFELEETVARQQTDVRDLEQKVEREKQRKQKATQKAEAVEQELRQKLNAAERETAELRQKIVDLELRSSANDRQSVRSPRHDASKYASPMQRFELSMQHEDYVMSDRRTNVLHSRTEGGASTPTFSPRSGPSTSDALGHLEVLRQRLHMLVLKHKEEVAKTKHRLADDCSHRSAGHSPEMLVLSKTLDNILKELQSLQASLSSDSGVTDLSHLLSPHQLNEKILHQNEELLQFVARITQEKQELRDTLANLEEEIWRYRQREASMTMAFKPRPSESSIADSLLTTERAQWSRERAQLTLALHNSERELHKMKKELREKEIEVEIEREQRAAMFSSSAQPDQEKMQRLYGHYLRAESYRKNLVYQKKYLLSLIGGFRDTEVETLQMLAKMGAYPSDRDVRRRSRHSRAMTKFRGAVRAVIALSRLRYLMKKWKRVKRVGSAVVVGNLPTNSTTYIPNTSNYFPSHASTTHSIGSTPFLESGRVHVTPTPARADYSPRHTQFSSPPTRDENHSRYHSYSKSSPEQHSHRHIYPGADSVSSHRSPSRSGDHERSLDQFIQKLEHLQQKLGTSQVSHSSSSRSTRGYHRR